MTSLPQNQKTLDFIAKATAVHTSGKYTYAKANYIKSSEKVVITCTEHGDFNQTPNDHLKGSGCRKCGYATLAARQGMTAQQFIAKARAVHPDAKYNYSHVVYTNNKTKVTIVCAAHGEFAQSPNDHLRGTGCPTCKCATKVRQYNVKTWIAAARKVHGADTYDYSKVTEYKNIKQKLTIICKVHGEFEQTAGHHLQMSGCKKCNTYSTKEYIARVYAAHKTDAQSSQYDYSQVVYTNARGIIKITCKKHSATPFLQRADKHLAGAQGCAKYMMCPKCELWKTGGAECDYCKSPTLSKKYEKTKEMKIVAYLRAEFPDNHFVHNKSVGKDCTDSHLFPDICYDCGKFFLIVEIDEHKHRGASYKCDEARMCDIVAKLGLPCVFIRYNPDAKSSDITKLRALVAKYLAVTTNNNSTSSESFYEKTLGITNSARAFVAEYLFY